MPNTPSITNLHLRYRLWIAELNQDITVLRIFNDYIAEAESSALSAETSKHIEEFKNSFLEHRKKIDELKHSMHLLKMKLAADAKKIGQITPELYKADNHIELKKQYLVFRKAFESFKKDFILFESR